jgi:hypothetical protein
MSFVFKRLTTEYSPETAYLREAAAEATTEKKRMSFMVTDEGENGREP